MKSMVIFHDINHGKLICAPELFRLPLRLPNAALLCEMNHKRNKFV